MTLLSFLLCSGAALLSGGAVGLPFLPLVLAPHPSPLRAISLALVGSSLLMGMDPLTGLTLFGLASALRAGLCRVANDGLRAQCLVLCLLALLWTGLHLVGFQLGSPSALFWLKSGLWLLIHALICRAL